MSSETTPDELRGRRAVAELARRAAMRRFLAGEIDLAEYDRRAAVAASYAEGEDTCQDSKQPA